MTKTLTQPRIQVKWICPECAAKRGLNQRRNMSFSLGRCDVCDERNMVTAPTNYTEAHQ